MPMADANDFVIAAGRSLGAALMEDAKDALNLPMEQQIMFFTALLVSPVICMKNALGVEATQAILDTCKEQITN